MTSARPFEHVLIYLQRTVTCPFLFIMCVDVNLSLCSPMCARTCVSRQVASFIRKRYNLPQNLHRHNPSEQLVYWYIPIILGKTQFYL